MSAGCLERIQSFLLSDSVAKHAITTDLSPNKITDITDVHNTIELEPLNENDYHHQIIRLQKVSIAPSPSTPVILHDIDFQASKESLTMVIGIVGSGKSTLLKAIIGELECCNGTFTSNARDMAYCSQTAWLPNTTVRNIVCGPIDEAEIDDRWYNTVLYACAFDEDVITLPDQHDTLIGSRGVILSGGQKQRLVCA
jgi:ATP-binding cassette subfamily C (CFTR/MRP) protein 1